MLPLSIPAHLFFTGLLSLLCIEIPFISLVGNKLSPTDIHIMEERGAPLLGRDGSLSEGEGREERREERKKKRKKERKLAS